MNYVRVGGYIPPQPIEDYNDLPNIPVISQDLTASGFTPIANTYYKHTGATTASYTNGVIYYYNSTGYIALDGSAYGLATVAKTGSYNDLSNKPTIPDAANNGTLTIQKNGTNVQTFTANQSSSVTANIIVPTKVSQLQNDSGYTTNKGTVTSVSVKMNGASKGTVTSSGTIDLGTVITAHQDISGKLDKTAYEVNKTINFGRDGALYIGKFKVYDTNVTCEVTSTTSVTYSGKLVIATQNYVIREMTVYGDAANTVAPNIYIKPSSESDQYIEVYFKPESWSKNVIHIYGSAIEAEPTNVCTNVPSVPSTATLKPKNALNSKANLRGGNTFTGKQTFTDPPTNNAYSIDASGCVRGSWFQSSTIMHNDSSTGKVCVFDGSGWIFYRTPAEILTEAGGAKTADLPIKSATLTGTTLYLTL